MSKHVHLKSGAFAIAACLAGGANTARADGKIDVGVFLGYHWFNDDNQIGRLDAAQDPVDDSFIVGLRAGYRFHQMASIEGELAYLPAQTRDDNTKASTLAYRLHLLVHPWRFVDGKLEPFGVLGIGGTTVWSGDTSKLDDDSDFVWHFGAGVRYFLREDLGIRLDLRFPVAPAVDSLATLDTELLVSVFKTFGGTSHARPAEAQTDQDRDHDGILDSSDTCPDQPETMNSIDDTDGCPDEVPAQVQAFNGVIKGVEFETDSDTLRASSNTVLDKAIEVLKQFPTIKLEIAGHTDSQGAADHNRDLSQRRAEAVKKYLVDHGIGDERLEAVGYGPDKPIADNGTPEGRQQNRRVEFHTK